MILVVARLRVRPGATPAMLRELDAFARLTRAEKGCIEYLPLRAPEDESLIVIIEQWEDEAALRAHLATVEMADYRARTKELVLERSHAIFGPTSLAS